MTSKFLRTGAAAEYLGVSRALLEKLRIVGGGPRFCRLGRAVTYSTAALDDWAAQREHGSTSEYPTSAKKVARDRTPDQGEAA